MPAVILITYLSLLMLGLLDNVRGPFFFEILQDLHLSGTAGSAFFAVASLLATVGSWYSHALLKNRDPLKVMAIVSVIFAFGMAAISRAPSFVFLLAGSAVFGWGYGTLNALQNVTVSAAAPVASRRRYLNGLQSMYGLAAWLAPLTATSLRLAGLDWRTVFLGLAFLPLVMAVPAWLKQGNLRLHAEGPAPIWTGRDKKLCVGFAALLAVYLWGELSISTRLVLWLRTQQGFSAEAADAQLALFFLLLLVGRMTLAFVHLKSVSNWMILMCAALLSALLYLLGLFVSPLFVALCGLTLAPFYPVIMDQIAHTFGGKTPKAMGIIIAVGNLSIMAMHLAVGVLTDLSNLSSALMVGPVALILTGGALVWVQARASLKNG